MNFTAAAASITATLNAADTFVVMTLSSVYRRCLLPSILSRRMPIHMPPSADNRCEHDANTSFCPSQKLEIDCVRFIHRSGCSSPLSVTQRQNYKSLSVLINRLLLLL